MKEEEKSFGFPPVKLSTDDHHKITDTAFSALSLNAFLCCRLQHHRKVTKGEYLLALNCH